MRETNHNVVSRSNGGSSHSNNDSEVTDGAKQMDNEIYMNSLDDTLQMCLMLSTEHDQKGLVF